MSENSEVPMGNVKLSNRLIALEKRVAELEKNGGKYNPTIAAENAREREYNIARREAAESDAFERGLIQ